MPTPNPILVVDDEPLIRRTLCRLLDRHGYPAIEAEHGAQALELLEQHDIDVALTDIKMPVMDGMEFLRRARAIRPQLMVIVSTAYASVETAIQALREGAYDYLIKPVELDDVLNKIGRLVERRAMEQELASLRQELHRQYDFAQIIGQSAPMRRVFDVIRRVADMETTVLVTGESGTGKELIARAIHYNGRRSGQRFVPINCAALPENLIESELFGYKRGAFTGAMRDKDGLFRAASGGTLFLDEIGEIPPHIQVKLLRALEQKEIVPVGSSVPEKIDTRIVAATNRDLAADVEAGTFRKDLYYRLNVVNIHLPSLRERPDDIPLLVQHFLNKYSAQMRKPVHTVDNEAMKRLVNHTWKGEVRELENTIERGLIFANGTTLTVDDLPSLSGASVSTGGETGFDDLDDLREAVERFERFFIQRQLKKHDHHRGRTAGALGISEASLYRKLKDLAITEST